MGSKGSKGSILPMGNATDATDATDPQEGPVPLSSLGPKDFEAAKSRVRLRLAEGVDPELIVQDLVLACQIGEAEARGIVRSVLGEARGHPA